VRTLRRPNPHRWYASAANAPVAINASRRRLGGLGDRRDGRRAARVRACSAQLICRRGSAVPAPLSDRLPGAMNLRSLARFGLAIPSLVLFAALAAVALVHPAPSAAYLYWISNRSAIDRADLNGGGLQQGFVSSPYPQGGFNAIVPDSPYIILAGGGNGGQIGRANLDGTGIVPDILTIPQPLAKEPLAPAEVEIAARAVATSGPYLYWTDNDSNRAEPSRESIGRANVDDGSVEPNFIKTGAPAYMMTVAAGHIYWIAEHAISRAKLDGSDIEPNFIPLQVYTNGLAVAEGHIYWTTQDTVARANLDGHDIEPNFIAKLGLVNEVAVGGGYIFWTTEQKREYQGHLQRMAFSIGRANLNGTHVRPNFMKLAQPFSWGLVVDGLGPGAAHPPKITNRPKHPIRKHTRR
jgi:hypothetical protein